MRIFKKLKVQSVVVSLLYLVLGICLLAVPDAAKRTVCYFAGAMLIVSGLVQIINYFLYSVVRFGFLWGIIDVFAGIFIVSSADIFAQTEIFALLFGILLVGKSIFEFQTAADMKRFGVKFWWRKRRTRRCFLSWEWCCCSTPSEPKGRCLFISACVLCLTVFWALRLTFLFPERLKR